MEISYIDCNYTYSDSIIHNRENIISAKTLKYLDLIALLCLSVPELPTPEVQNVGDFIQEGNRGGKGVRRGG